VIGAKQQTEIMTIDDALLDVEIAFRQLEFAIKLLSYCELGHITPADFDSDHVVDLGTERLHFPPGKFNDEDSLIRAASTHVLIAFSASVLALDDVFSAAGIKKRPEGTSNDEQLRTLVYMARCAVAHGIADPRWEARGPYGRVLTVTLGATITPLDLSQLNGQPFDVGQLGGYGNWYRIRDEAVRLVQAAKP
jgi:hypothetical protein